MMGHGDNCVVNVLVVLAVLL